MKKLLLTLVIVVLMVATASADRRKYVWTYQYQTIPSKTTELEFYQTTKVRDTDDWEFRFEVEQGLTSHWDLSIYQIFAQNEGESMKWDAVQMRTRIRIGEEGMYPLDPLIYLEYNRKTDFKRPNKLEAKVILAKNIEKANISFNPLYEYFFGPGSEHEIGMDAGASWEFSPVVSAGVESVTRVEFEDGESETATYLGPTISVASGHWWYSAGVIFGLNDNSDDARVRFLMGVGI